MSLSRKPSVYDVYTCDLWTLLCPFFFLSRFICMASIQRCLYFISSIFSFFFVGLWTCFSLLKGIILAVVWKHTHTHTVYICTFSFFHYMHIHEDRYTVMSLHFLQLLASVWLAVSQLKILEKMSNSLLSLLKSVSLPHLLNNYWKIHFHFLLWFLLPSREGVGNIYLLLLLLVLLVIDFSHWYSVYSEM